MTKKMLHQAILNWRCSLHIQPSHQWIFYESSRFIASHLPNEFLLWDDGETRNVDPVGCLTKTPFGACKITILFELTDMMRWVGILYLLRDSWLFPKEYGLLEQSSRPLGACELLNWYVFSLEIDQSRENWSFVGPEGFWPVTLPSSLSLYIFFRLPLLFREMSVTKASFGKL